MIKKMALAALLFFAPFGAYACPDSSPICTNYQQQKVDSAQSVKGKKYRRSASAESHTRSYSNGSSLISEAHRWLGASARQMGVPSRLWCMDGLNVWLANTGHKTVNSRRAIDALKLGPRIDYARVGAVAVTKRRGGHHVSVILADNGSTFTAISPNHNRAVGIGEYPKRIVVAYVQPQ